MEPVALVRSVASVDSGVSSGVGAPVVHEPDLSGVAPVFDVTVGLDDVAVVGDDAGYEVSVGDTICGSGADGLRVVRSVSRRVCVGPLSPGHGYVVRWRAVHEDEAGPVSGEGAGASRGPWSRGVLVRVAGGVGPMVDLRDEDADDVGRALGLAGSQTRHSRRWLWVRGPEVVSVAGSRAVRGVWLFGGLPRPSVTVRGSGVDADGGLVQPLVVRVSSSVDRVSVWTVQAVAVGDDGGERAGLGVECEGLFGSGEWFGWVGWRVVGGTWCAGACGVAGGSRCRCGAVG